MAKQKVASRPALGPKAYLKRLKGLKASGFSTFDDDFLSAGSFSEFIPTGSLAVDKIIRGWPVGGISECAAWEHVAKSHLLDLSLAQCQRLGGITALIDSEKAREKKWTRAAGVDTARLILKQADTLEQAFAGIDELCDAQESFLKENVKVPMMLIGWDSLGGMPSKAELEGVADDKHMAVAARVIKMNFRRITQRLARLRIALVFTNHFYENIGGYGGLKTYGGSGVRYHTAVRIWLTSPGKVMVGEREVGHIVRVKAKKNRVRGVGGEPIDTALIYGAGIDNAYTLFEWGLETSNGEQKWIVRNGAWYWLHLPELEPIAFQNKSQGLGQILRAHPEFYQTMVDAFLKEE
jgi:recombination protein RecA